MSGKTISTGTLGLRFMQNAQRAKQLKEVEAERAHVKDEAEWEVDQKVRDSWSSSNASLQTATHETSYLPFLFPSLEQSTDPSPSERPKGRRAFNKKGEEIAEKVPEPIAAQPEDQKAPQSVTKKPRVHPHPRPVSISGSSGMLSGFPQQAKSTKTAKEAIYDNTGVGADLRGKPVPTVPVFLKPSGVDEPSAPKPNTTKTRTVHGSTGSPRKSNDEPSTSNMEGDIIPSTRSKKVKRERSTADQMDGEGTKRKKKKSIT